MEYLEMVVVALERWQMHTKLDLTRSKARLESGAECVECTINLLLEPLFKYCTGFKILQGFKLGMMLNSNKHHKPQAILQL